MRRFRPATTCLRPATTCVQALLSRLAPWLVSPDGSVRMTAAVPETRDVEGIRMALRKWRGTGVLKQSTEEIMRFTRGEDAMR